jgi:hypothetical protein
VIPVFGKKNTAVLPVREPEECQGKYLNPKQWWMRKLCNEERQNLYLHKIL